MPRILFVDDEKQVLDGLRRMLRPLRKQWDMVFVESAADALDALGKDSFEVIVTDMRMPVMDGAELLEIMRTRYPSMVRIILSGHSEQKKIMKSVRPAHQYLAKPVGKTELVNVLHSALQLHSVLGDPCLMDILGQAESLPSMPSTYANLIDAIEDDESSLEDVGKIIEHDLGLTATMLKVVNSAFFGLPRKIASPAQAASLLGLDIIRSLVLSYNLFSTLEIKDSYHFSFDGLWRHCTAVGSMAKNIAKYENMDQAEIDEAFMAGILHDVGKLTLYHFTPKKYRKIIEAVRSGDGSIYQMESNNLNTSHAEAGAFLMGLWGLPENIVRAIAFHHLPGAWEPQEFGLHTIVHAANVFEHELHVVHKSYLIPPLATDHLQAVGAVDRVDAWRDVCQDILSEGNCRGE